MKINLRNLRSSNFATRKETFSRLCRPYVLLVKWIWAQTCQCSVSMGACLRGGAYLQNIFLGEGLIYPDNCLHSFPLLDALAIYI